jgi:hypothetical protein
MDMILKEHLEPMQYYVGEGRFMGYPCVAMWDGLRFVGLGSAWNMYEANTAEYGERGFSPYKSVLKV